MVTYFVVQPYLRGKKGMLIADQARQARDHNHCVMMAEKLSNTFASVVAFSRTGEPETGDWQDAIVIASYGEVPDELLEMAS